MAIKRVNLYLDAGADLAFITYVETLDEVKQIMKKVKGPVSIAAGMPYNIREFSIADLKECGVARVSLPTILIFSSLQAISRSLRQIMEEDGFSSIIKGELLYSDHKLTDLLNK